MKLFKVQPAGGIQLQDCEAEITGNVAGCAITDTVDQQRCAIAGATASSVAIQQKLQRTDDEENSINIAKRSDENDEAADDTMRLKYDRSSGAVVIATGRTL
jgi:hypothetical protein